MRRLYYHGYTWTIHAQERCQRDGHNLEDISRILPFAGVYSDPNGRQEIRLRLFDVCTIHVHPELESYFGLLVVMDGRTIISLYNIIWDRQVPEPDNISWTIWYKEHKASWQHYGHKPADKSPPKVKKQGKKKPKVAGGPLLAAIYARLGITLGKKG